MKNKIIKLLPIMVFSGFAALFAMDDYENKQQEILKQIEKDEMKQYHSIAPAKPSAPSVQIIDVVKDEDILDQQEIMEMAMIETIAHVIWCENRSSKESLQMVASVIYNRAGSGKLEDLYKVVVKPNQFECYSKNIIAAQVRNKRDMRMLTIARNLVLDMLEDKFQPITKATHFIAPKKLKKKPSWVKEATVVANVEGHTYMVFDRE